MGGSPKPCGHAPAMPNYVHAPQFSVPGLDTSELTHTWGNCEPALDKGSLSSSLQKNLEQLLKQQSLLREADKNDSFGSPMKLPLQPERVSPSKVFCHGG